MNLFMPMARHIYRAIGFFENIKKNIKKEEAENPKKSKHVDFKFYTR
jgi:hypothetical protein